MKLTKTCGILSIVLNLILIGVGVYALDQARFSSFYDEEAFILASLLAIIILSSIYLAKTYRLITFKTYVQQSGILDIWEPEQEDGQIIKMNIFIKICGIISGLIGLGTCITGASMLSSSMMIYSSMDTFWWYFLLNFALAISGFAQLLYVYRTFNKDKIASSYLTADN
ncbi:hypothetical protein JYU20_01130 [Bacteroidales bacterium AH-315-I05]|nr:hypothetical protein [Bacteroidales bacterium AH-315-I05]